MSARRCTCHQCSGDSWDCPEHYKLNRRFREAKRIVELVNGPSVEGDTDFDTWIRKLLRTIDKENARRDKAFWKEANAELDRRGL